MRVVVTGAAGFIGRHLVLALSRRADVHLATIDRGTPLDAAKRVIAASDVVFHLAGVNRPPDVADFDEGNRALTEWVCAAGRAGAPRRIVFTSSIHADGATPYGQSKRSAEEALRRWSEATGGEAIVFRLPNVFGKWARPNYNSAVATFCDAIGNDRPYSVRDPSAEVALAYVDDVIAALVGSLDQPPQTPGFHRAEVFPIRTVNLGAIERQLRDFRDIRSTLVLPDLSDPFVRALYATYTSYIAPAELVYPLHLRVDTRGALAEFLKSDALGQIFVSRTVPGITRGNHFHDTKAEKFLVVAGEGLVRLRHVDGDGPVIEHRVSGVDFRVVDIPPGYAHSIENVGTEDMVVVFWASEAFDPQRPDTYMEDVLRG